MKHTLRCLSVLALVLVLGCSDDGDSRGSKGGGSGGGAGGTEGEPVGDPAPGIGGHDDAGEPKPFVPENEVEVALQAPQGGERYVFVVSTGLDAVVRIDAETLKVDLIEVGGSPTLMQTLPTQDGLVVINAGTQDFSIFRSSDAGAAP